MRELHNLSLGDLYMYVNQSNRWKLAIKNQGARRENLGFRTLVAGAYNTFLKYIYTYNHI